MRGAFDCILTAWHAYLEWARGAGFIPQEHRHCGSPLGISRFLRFPTFLRAEVRAPFAGATTALLNRYDVA